MAEYSKPMPSPTVESAPFWEGAKRRELLIQQCRDCGAYRHYPRLLCPKCHSASADWVKASGRGTIYTYTITHRPFHPGFAAEAPYATVTVELEEGVRMVGRLVDVRPEEITIGLPLQVEFLDVTEEVTLPVFKRLPTK